VAVLQIFAEQTRATGREGQRDDQRIMEAEAPARLHGERALECPPVGIRCAFGVARIAA